MKTALALPFGSLICVVLGLAACAPDDAACDGDACDGPLAERVEHVLVNGTPNPWPLPDGQMRLCFTNKNLAATDFPIARDRIVSVLNGSWGNGPNLHFLVGCAPPAMGITLQRGTGWGNCGVGNGASCVIATDPSQWSANPKQKADLDGAAIHEVGHGLGMQHEHQRADAPPLCPTEQAILDGCRACTGATCSVQQAVACWFHAPASSTITLTQADKDAAAFLFAVGYAQCMTCASGVCQVGECKKDPTTGVETCTAQSFVECANKAQPTAGTINLSVGDRDDAIARRDDRVVKAGRYLTAYDPVSVMNYCGGVNGRAEGDSTPTARDMLGMEILYSPNRNYGIGCGQGCFVTSAGVVTTSTGSVVSEWIRRGSLNVPFRVNGTSTDVFSYPVTTLPSGTSTLGYSFRDAGNNLRNGSGTVNKSNPAYAALAGAVAMIP